MPTALVTGISVQDGGYLTEALLADGWRVHGVVHDGDAMIDTLRGRCPDVSLHEADLADSEAVARVVAEVEPDEIYNLGGISSVAFSWSEPLLTARVTGLGAAALLDAAWQLQVRTGRPVRLLQASSAEIFGDALESPQTERTPIRPQTPYGAAKAFAHTLVGVYRGRGLPACACILYNHESPRRPDTFVTRKITKAAARIAAGGQQRLALGNLDARRDWGWAPDYVDAMRRAIRHPVADDYVVATGVTRSVADFAAAAFAYVGLPDWRSFVDVDESLNRPVDALEQAGDATKAREVLGWRPTVSFEEMVARMVDADVRPT